MEFLAVGISSEPILVHLLGVRLKPLKYAASWFLIVLLEACSSESFLPQEGAVHPRNTRLERTKWINGVSMSLNGLANSDLLRGSCAQSSDYWAIMSLPHGCNHCTVWSVPPKSLTQFIDAKTVKGTAVRADWKTNASGMGGSHRPWETTLKDMPKPPQQSDETLLDASEEWWHSG